MQEDKIRKSCISGWSAYISLLKKLCGNGGFCCCILRDVLALTSTVKCHLGKKKGKEANLCALQHPHKQKPCIEDHASGLEMQNQIKCISCCCHRMGQKKTSSKHHLYQKGGELWSYCLHLAQSSGKGVRLIRAGYLCRLPAPPTATWF